MLRFAILEHDYPVPHWDLFLEAGDVLRSWRLLSPLEPGIAVPAEPTGDHRLLYLDYEGPVSVNRGTVARIDAGTFAWEADVEECVVVRIAGTHFVGRLILQRDSGHWTCRFE
jgi:DNA polymerase Ligase (LigD)